MTETTERLSPQKLADTLTKFYEMHGRDGQLAGGMFGLLYAEHMEAGSLERSPNTIADIAELTCGADVNVGFKMAPHIKEIFGRAAARAAARHSQQQAQEMFDAMCQDSAAEMEAEHGRP